jgi:hypothetical protein
LASNASVRVSASYMVFEGDSLIAQ